MVRITPTPDGRSMLVSNVSGSAVQLVDVATLTGHLAAGRGPDGLGYSTAFVRK